MNNKTVSVGEPKSVAEILNSQARDILALADHQNRMDAVYCYTSLNLTSSCVFLSFTMGHGGAMGAMAFRPKDKHLVRSVVFNCLDIQGNEDLGRRVYQQVCKIVEKYPYILTLVIPEHLPLFDTTFLTDEGFEIVRVS